ncbi:MAG: O-antigen ligase family protein [Bacteroidota bacterium]
MVVLALTILLAHSVVSVASLFTKPVYFIRYHIICSAVFASGVLEVFEGVKILVGTREIKIAGLIWLVSLSIMGVYILLSLRNVRQYDNFLTRRYLWFLGWVFLVQVFVGSTTFSGILHFLELLYPFVIFLICYAFVRPGPDTVSILAAYKWYAGLLCVLIPVNYLLFGYNEMNVLNYARVMSTSLLPAFFLFFAQGIQKQKKMLFPATVLLLIPVLTISRGVTVAVILAVLYYSVRTFLSFRRFKQLAFIMISLIVVTYGIVTSSAFQERTQAEGNIDPMDEGFVNTSGRLRIWLHFYDKIASASATSLLFGEGLGSSDEFTMESDESEWFKQPHSEYLRFLFNFGLVGVLLYFKIFIGLIRALRRRATGDEHSWLIGATTMLVYSLFILSLYENFLLYSPFGFTQNAFVIFAAALRITDTKQDN